MSNTRHSHRDTLRSLSRRHFMHQGLMLGSAVAATSMWLPSAWSKTAKLVNSPSVETAYGRVRGQVLDGVNAFYGVPYGASTAGRNRFMPPQTPEPWSGVRDTLVIGPVSPQLLIPGQLTPPFLKFCFDRPGTQYTEDCLNLNVWTSGVKDNAKRPVMVWLHGGGFTVGSSAPPAYDGGNLARQGDVVVVSVNHRLNAFGYTDLGALVGGDFADAGNAGMLDIVAALKWVRDNIEQFGGDPNRVTIFGESGGGVKVCLLMAMPSAKGLFHRAVIQSGPGVRIAERTSTSVTATELLKELGISPANVGKLQELTQEQIAKAAEKIGAKFGNGFSPLRDGVVIPRHPFDPNAPDVSRDVPLIVGYNRTEATLFMANDEAAFKLDDAGLRKRVEGMVGAQNASRIIDVYRATYPKANPSDILFYLWTDRGVWLSSARIAERKTALGGAPAYLYRFDWEAPYQGGFMRSAHTVEIPFVFNTLDNQVVQESFGKEAATRELGTRVSDMWIAFARTGKPQTAAMPQWPVFNGKDRATMIVNNESKVVADPDKEVRLALESLPPSRGLGG